MPFIYDDLTQFRNSLQGANFRSRKDFLEQVKFATVIDLGEWERAPDMSVLAVTALLAFGVFTDTLRCIQCHEPLSLKQRRVAYWVDLEDGIEMKQISYTYCFRGPRPRAARENPDLRCECFDKTVQICNNTPLAHVPVKCWMDWLDFLVMWSHEYSKDILYKELDVDH